MTINEMIMRLETVKREHGDIECLAYFDEEAGTVAMADHWEIMPNHRKLGTYLLIGSRPLGEEQTFHQYERNHSNVHV